MRTLASLVSLAVLAAVPAPGLAAFSYHLANESAVQKGCFGPCACAVLIQSPLVGSFALDPDASSGGFQAYRVADIRWSYKTQDDVTHQVTGSGTYRVNGDQQQMVVDLSVDGGAAERYDSGLTGGGASFPRIRLPIALNDFVCFDTVYGIDGNPVPAGVGDPAATFMLRAGPNPFRGSADVVFGLSKDGWVELRVHDLAGREVSTLVSGRFTAGPHAVTWDGRDGRGARVGAGVYFMRLRAEGRTLRATVVKIE
jgi:hypothetical protein